jgi:hypothetical protein
MPLLDFSDILLLAERVIETVSGGIHPADTSKCLGLGAQL